MKLILPSFFFGLQKLLWTHRLEGGAVEKFWPGPSEFFELKSELKLFDVFGFMSSYYRLFKCFFYITAF